MKTAPQIRCQIFINIFKTQRNLLKIVSLTKTPTTSKKLSVDSFSENKLQSMSASDLF